MWASEASGPVALYADRWPLAAAPGQATAGRARASSILAAYGGGTEPPEAGRADQSFRTKLTFMATRYSVILPFSTTTF